MTRGDITILKGLLSLAGDKNLRVLEWGSGNSTIYYSKFLSSVKRNFQWLAIESNRTWYERAIRQIRKNQLAERVQVRLYEFPDPRQAWQENRIHEALSSKEVQKYIYSPKDDDLQFDVIIVDGRLRRRCLLASLDILAPQGIVFLHDAHRTQYQSALESYPHVRFLLTGNSKLPQLVLCGLSSAHLIEKITDHYGEIATTGEWCDDQLFSPGHVSIPQND